MTLTKLSCSHDIESLSRAHLNASDDILCIVLILLVDALTVHHAEFIVEFAFCHLAIEKHTEVTTKLYAHQRVGSATCKIGDTLRTDIYYLRIGR